jgi:hypothetical protein
MTLYLSEIVPELTGHGLPNKPAEASRRAIRRITLHSQAPQGNPWFWTITARFPQSTGPGPGAGVPCGGAAVRRRPSARGAARGVEKD